MKSEEWKHFLCLLLWAASRDTGRIANFGQAQGGTQAWFPAPNIQLAIVLQIFYVTIMGAKKISSKSRREHKSRQMNVLKGKNLIYSHHPQYEKYHDT